MLYFYGAGDDDGRDDALLVMRWREASGRQFKENTHEIIRRCAPS